MMRLSKRILFLAVFISCISFPCRCGSMTGAGNARMAELMAEGIAAGEMAVGTVKMECIAAVYRAVYEEAIRTNTAGSLDMMRSMIAELGKRGYVAVDSENQVNMVNPELVLRPDFYSFVIKTPYIA